MRILRYIFYFAFISVLFGACFSFWSGDEDNLTIVWGNTGNNRSFVEEEDLASYRFTVTLTGPGPKQEETFTGVPSASFKVIPGLWTVTIKGEGISYITGPFPGTHYELKVMGIEQVEVTDGKNDPKVIKIYTATVVDSWDGLYFAVNDLSKTSGLYPSEDGPPREELILLTESFEIENLAEFPPEIYGIQINRPIILVTETPVVISNVNEIGDSFFTIIDGASLTLGLPGMTGTLTLNDNFYGFDVPIINISGDNMTTTFVLNSGVTITGRDNKPSGIHGGGVYVGGEDTIFTMNGGSIIGNEATIGGGVFVGYKATFIMNNGNIGKNASEFRGGGVFVDYDATFIMNGGTISNNTTDDGGGGVFVDGPGSFVMNGGTISGNAAVGEGGRGGGVHGYYNYDGRNFIHKGGVISGNSATMEGANIYMEENM